MWLLAVNAASLIRDVHMHVMLMDLLFFLDLILITAHARPLIDFQLGFEGIGKLAGQVDLNTTPTVLKWLLVGAAERDWIVRRLPQRDVVKLGSQRSVEFLVIVVHVLADLRQLGSRGRRDRKRKLHHLFLMF